jgi:hypothetical protein
MKLLLLILVIAGVPISIANASTIAKCASAEGNSYWHQNENISAEEAGWIKDKISGRTNLILTADGKYDLIVVDAKNNVSSFKQDGSEIVLLRKGTSDATFLHYHPDMVIELYTFWKSADDKNRFDILQSKGGDRLIYHFSAVMTGDCEFINLELIK